MRSQKPVYMVHKSVKDSLRNANIDLPALQEAAAHWGTRKFRLAIVAIIKEREADEIEPIL